MLLGRPWGIRKACVLVVKPPRPRPSSITADDDEGARGRRGRLDEAIWIDGWDHLFLKDKD